MTEKKSKQKRIGEIFPCADCGKPTIRKSFSHVVCPDCCKKRHKAASERWTISRRREKSEAESGESSSRIKGACPHRRFSKGPDAPSTLAKCPMCKTLHTVVGLEKPANGTTPYIYCEKCQPRVAAASDYSQTYGVGYL